MPEIEQLGDIFSQWDAMVILDCETTGFDAKTNKMIELAAMRIERGPVIAGQVSRLIKLPDGERVPDEIVKITNINDQMLLDSGVDVSVAAQELAGLLQGNRIIIAAHNAQFDLQFISELLRGLPVGPIDFLDTVTVFKDRHKYPHKLENAIIAYRLNNEVVNSHRAIDDVEALYHVMLAMDSERQDLATYINLFGYNAKYGINGRQIRGVRYAPQSFTDYMRSADKTLPALVNK